MIRGFVSAIVVCAVGVLASADDTDLRAEIDLLKQRLAQLEKRLEVAEAQSQSSPSTADSSDYVSAKSPSGKAAHPNSVDEDLSDIDSEFMDDDVSGASNWWERTSLGGYGEMHLNLGDEEQVDFHRWVLYLDHQFNDRFRLVSEVELEHSIAGDGKNGEFELEQAYIEADLGGGWMGMGGLFLVPVGILNETHEPTTFFGTERNPIEKEIMPSTWWEGGLAINKKTDSGFLWDAAFHSGLSVPIDGSNAYRIRSGRQKVSEADASEWAATTRLRYRGIPGIELGGSAQYQSDITPGDDEGNRAWLGEAHVDYRKGGFGLRALGGYWDISGESPAALGLDDQWGFYVEPSYTFSFGNGSRLGFFGRYNKYKAETGKFDQWDAGLNYWPIDNIVLKADYSRIDINDKDNKDIFNVGIGYTF